MEAERRHAYTIRLQCWWRGILAVRLKIRRRLLLKEVPLEDVEQEAEKAALVLQVFLLSCCDFDCSVLVRRIFRFCCQKTTISGVVSWRGNDD